MFSFMEGISPSFALFFFFFLKQAYTSITWLIWHSDMNFNLLIPGSLSILRIMEGCS